MAELDRIPTTTQMTTEPSDMCESRRVSVSSATPVKNTRSRVTRAATAQQKTKLIKIAPAPSKKSIS